MLDWLSRFNENRDGTFRDQAEQRVLWNIDAALESSLAAPLDPQTTDLWRIPVRPTRGCGAGASARRGRVTSAEPAFANVP